MVFMMVPYQNVRNNNKFLNFNYYFLLCIKYLIIRNTLFLHYHYLFCNNVL